QAEDGIRDFHVTGVQTCALPIFRRPRGGRHALCNVQAWFRQGRGREQHRVSDGEWEPFEIAGFRVGHWTHPTGATGCTVIVADKIGSASRRGSGEYWVCV